VLSTYAYDNASRVPQVSYSKSGFPTETHAYTWDAGPNAKGRISQVIAKSRVRLSCPGILGQVD